MAESWEAIEYTAERTLDAVGDDRDGGPALPRRWPAVDALRSAAVALETLDAARGTLVAEAAVWMALRADLARYREATNGATVRLREGDEPVPWRLLPGAVSAESSRARRELLWKSGDRVATEQRTGAVEVVAALREITHALGDGLTGALGMGDVDDEAAAVLDATEDAFAELDAWAVKQLAFDGARRTWCDRLRVLVAPGLLRELPPAAWGDVATAWYFRVGLEDAVRGVRDRRRPAALLAEGTEAWIGSTARVLGRPRNVGFDAGEVFGALATGAAAVLGAGPSPGHRRGVHRALDGAAHALGRLLLTDPIFLSRDAGLSGSARERAARTALHAELLRVRWDAAMARWVRAALRRDPGLTERFVAEIVRAWSVAPEPVWAVHLAARAFEPGGAWPGRSAARTQGFLRAVSLRESLRERFDDDWFRNPRTGGPLRGAWDALRARGPEGELGELASALQRWLRDALDGLR